MVVLLTKSKTNGIYIDGNEGEGQNQRTIILPCIFIELSPLNQFSQLLPVWAIPWKVQKVLKSNLVYR